MKFFWAEPSRTTCLDQLAAAGRRERVDFLIQKQRVNHLSDEEKAELRQLR